MGSAPKCFLANFLAAKRFLVNFSRMQESRDTGAKITQQFGRARKERRPTFQRRREDRRLAGLPDMPAQLREATDTRKSFEYNTRKPSISRSALSASKLLGHQASVCLPPEGDPTDCDERPSRRLASHPSMLEMPSGTVRYYGRQDISLLGAIPRAAALPLEQPPPSPLLKTFLR